MSDNPENEPPRHEPYPLTGGPFDPPHVPPAEVSPPAVEPVAEPPPIDYGAPPPPIVPPPPPVEERRGSGGLGVLLFLVFIVLGGAVGYVWYGGTREDQSLAARVAALESRPAPSSKDIDALAQRVAALEKQAQTPAPAAAPAATPANDEAAQKIATRVAALEQRVQGLATAPAAGAATAPAQPAANAGPAAPTQTAQQAGAPGPGPASPDFKALEQRVAALEQRTMPADIATKADVVALAGRMDALAGREDQVSGQYTTSLAAFSGRLDAEDGLIHQNAAATAQTNQQLAALTKQTDERLTALGKQIDDRIEALDKTIEGVQAQIGTLQKSAAELPGLTERAAKLARLQVAQMALETGQPLGAIPDAPPALARFGGSKPPTEAQLRLAFPAAARAAEQAESQLPPGATFLDRVRANAEGLFTIRRGDTVVVGNPASGVLARARQALDAGDLAGAVDAVAALQGPAAQAMAGWLDQARALVAARAALAQMAAHA
ncbi:MAG TPA: mitofilin family membrane protein [Acidisphaera sp.]|nr:mitofilin family membrane protein [Acidisphaera sp.]